MYQKWKRSFSQLGQGGCGVVCLGGKRVQGSYGKCLQVVYFFLDCFLLEKCPTEKKSKLKYGCRAITQKIVANSLITRPSKTKLNWTTVNTCVIKAWWWGLQQSRDPVGYCWPLFTYSIHQESSCKARMILSINGLPWLIHMLVIEGLPLTVSSISLNTSLSC